MFLPVFNLNYLIYMLPAILLSLIVQFYVNSRYAQWGRERNRAGLTGVQVAQQLSERMGMYNLKLKGVPGRLTDHYDPRNNVLSLSRDIAQGQTVASMAITAHELGHAQQDQEAYLPMKIRSAMVPVVNIGTSLGWIFILIGLLLNLSLVGRICFLCRCSFFNCHFASRDQRLKTCQEDAQGKRHHSI